MATSLVTGGAGFIGAHLARALVQRGDTVVVLDDLSGGFADNVPEGAFFVHASITDERAVERVFAEHRFDYVYHLAAYAAEGLSHFIRAFNYTNNVVGSMHIINACVRHEVQCLVFTSSIAVYGAGQLPMREELVPQPEDPYGVAKYAVELDLRAAHEMFGLKSVVFRPHNVYGEFQNIGDRYRNVIGIFMNRLMHGEPMPIFGDGTQTRAFSYVGDIIPALAHAVHTPAAFGEVFNVGADRDYSVNELASVVADALGAERRVQHLDARREVQHAYSDHSKVRRVFGAQPETPLAEGIRRMAEWARVVGPRQSQAFENIEVTRNLPPAWQG
ncbi:MAG TPA: NAD-dependent epimerase/dehydratase family protein [Gemmatimonadaceae bacterium]|jgi:UDP-glucose 4-epimerase|nr:NAD-dependent epimerase/dehydratase family protein [Gemmatimonadaceae bacterium]